MAVTSDSRARMVASAATLIGTHGVSATSFSDVLADSGAPRGSIYHHFPDGKRQLAQDAVRWTGRRVLAFQDATTPATATEVLDRFIGMWRGVVVGSNAAAGCVVAGVTVDTDAGDGLIDVARETFASWIGLLDRQLQDVGLDADRAAALATMTLAGMEGALILCRARGDVGPLDLVADQLRRLV